MLFNSLSFLIFLAVTLTAFHQARRWGGDAQAVVLLVASVVFYGWGAPQALLLIALSIGVNYLVASRTASSNAAFAWGLAFNIALLAAFKYAAFAAQNLNLLVGAAVLPVPEMALPLGISFFTFQQIEYLSDVRRGHPWERSPVRFALFVTYFPHLIAGPMVPYRDLGTQFLRLGRGLRSGNLAAGLSMFAIGLFKKTVIADGLSQIVAPIFGASAGSPPEAVHAWGAALAYGFQIYFDFSAYSDMALGLARMMGLRLPVNFFSPYKAGSPIEFWRRWHITLSGFLARHIYMPLGGNRRGTASQVANIMVTMLLGGLWHGANWTFVLWGGGHGLLIALNHLWRRLGGPVLPRPLTIALTFTAVTILWVPFRADGFGRALEILQGMAFLHGAALPDGLLAHAGGLGRGLTALGVQAGGSAFEVAVMGVWLAAAGAVAFLLPNTAELFGRHLPPPPSVPASGTRLRWRPSLGWAAAMGFLGAVGLMRLSSPSDFLYFRF